MQTEKGNTKSSKGLSYRNSDRARTARKRVGLVETDPLRIVGCRAALDTIAGVEVVLTTVSGLVLDRSIVLGVLGRHRIAGLEDKLAVLGEIRPDLHLLVLETNADAVSYDREVCQTRKARPQPVGISIHENSGPLDLRRAALACLSMPGQPIHRQRLKRDEDRSTGRRPDIFPTLTPTTRLEQQILEQLLRADSNRGIAENLGIDEKAVNHQIAQLMHKIGVDDRMSLSLYALHRYHGRSH